MRVAEGMEDGTTEQSKTPSHLDSIPWQGISLYISFSSGHEQ